MTGEEAREVFVRTLEELQDEGLYLGPIPPLEPRKRAKRAPSRPRKKSLRPTASVSSGAFDDLEHDMKQLTADPFWRAARPAGREIERLPHLAEAMDWLRGHQPKAHWQLTEFWVERLRGLWESGKLGEFREALDTWVQLHVEVCATYQLVRTLQKP